MGKRSAAPAPTVAETNILVKKEVLSLDSPLNCLAANNNARHLAVGGRSVFKIFDCQKQHFEEVANLRNNSNFDNQYLSVNDVTWCKFDEKVLVSASNQGAVLIWDVQNNGQIVREYGMTEHQRTVNSMEFHPDSSNLLLVASQDGLCQTIDLRRKESLTTFTPIIESPARDVQFDPRFPTVFAVVFENGCGRLWDMRNPNQYVMQWIAHGGPAACVDWHPTENWLLTGGRDKTAAVWDMTVRNQSRRLTNMYLAETVAAVGRVRWRPGHKYQMVATPMLTETYIGVWDVRRPFIPEGYFMEHRETIGGVLWKDESIFYTCGRDGKLCRFLYEDCYRFREELNPAALSISIYGNILYSAHEEIGSKTKNAQNDNLDKALTMNSITYEISGASEDLSMEPFIYMAQNYKLAGDSVVNLCGHNAQVALDAGRHLIHHTWSMLATMHWNSVPSPVREGGVAGVTGVSLGGVVVGGVGGGVTSKKSSKTEVKTVAFKDVSTDEKETETSYKKSSAGVSQEEDDSDSASEEVLIKDNPYFRSSSYIYSTPDIFSLKVYNVDLSDKDDDLDGESSQVEQDINVYSENDQFRKYTDFASFDLQYDDSESPTMEQGTRSRRVEVEEVLKYEILNSVPYVNTIMPFDYLPVIIQMIEYFINENDVQSAVSIILTLGNTVISRFDSKLIELWVLSYLDQLSEFELYMIATDVQNIFQPDIPQMSTSVKIACSRCFRTMRNGWTCKKCQAESKENLFHVCALCHQPVKGLYVWCQGCAHGGHIEHMTKWFSNHTECPTGCGHFCEYS